jgi:hypothetical protein
MKRQAFSLILILTLTVVGSVTTYTYAKDYNHPQQRTWKTVAELSPEDLQKIDLTSDTPRHTQVPYLPAESYPFSAPYTAEEMGYRVMEFTPRPRWSSVVANVWGSISDQGVLLNPGKSITFIDYTPKARGVEAELTLKPGAELYRSLSQNIFPPAAEGSQWLAIRYRTDTQFIKKEERFRYSSSIRRVRHEVPFRRQSKFPNMALTPDDSYGRDAWEFSWRILGTDVLHQTVRFPKTRPTIILRDGESGRFEEVQTTGLKLMGKAYPAYTAEGGVECYVVEARAREEWLPNYYVPRLLFWLDKYSFFPLRIEQYGADGSLVHIEVRLAELFNPALQERGYGSLFIVHWDIASDIMSYLVNDSHRLMNWNREESSIFFNPDFMRRQWYLDTSIKTQAEVSHPDEFFLRPALEEGKFPSERPLQLPTKVVARVRAQEAAGRLVFEVQEEPSEVSIRATHQQGAAVRHAEDSTNTLPDMRYGQRSTFLPEVLR